MLAILSVECVHCGLYGRFGFAGDLHGDVVVGYSLNEGKDHSFFPVSQPYHCVSFPMPQLDTLINNARTLLDTGSFGTLVDTALSLSATAFQDVRHVKER
jgi:hypothetical protein